MANALCIDYFTTNGISTAHVPVSKPSCDLKPFSTIVTFEDNMFYYKLVLMTALFLVHFGMCQDFIKESNMWQLDKDSFWKIAHRMEIHSVIELYSSDSWCGK